jgi:hypothetical protein
MLSIVSHVCPNMYINNTLLLADLFYVDNY